MIFRYKVSNKGENFHYFCFVNAVYVNTASFHRLFQFFDQIKKKEFENKSL